MHALTLVLILLAQPASQPTSRPSEVASTAKQCPTGAADPQAAYQKAHDALVTFAALR